jgi:PKD repeat protein/pimeloyl-ACP methyl ester carboxylesterase
MKKLFNYLIYLICFIILSATTIFSAKLPYPIIFVHGLAGSDETFQRTMEYLRYHYVLGPINVFDIILNADNDLSKSTIESDVKWEDFIFRDTLINLGRRSFAEDMDDFSDGWNADIPPNIFAINFKEERIRGANHLLNDYFDQSNQAGIFKQGKALNVMINEVLDFTNAEKVVLVGHSMGGLAIREYLQRTDENGQHRWWVSSDSQNGHKVARVVTIGTPHLGSNSWVDSTRKRRPSVRSGVADFNGTSESLRDLKYTFDSYPNCNTLNPVGIYLFGGNEHCIAGTEINSTFNNVDIDCNGSETDDIIGLNLGTTYNPDMPLPLDIYYTWIISDSRGGEKWYCAQFNCYNEPAGDGAVLYDRQWLYENDISSPAGISYILYTNMKHLEEGSDYQTIIQALDEPGDQNLAYTIELDQTIYGFINIQPDGKSDDSDIFKIHNPTPACPSMYRVSISCLQNIVQEISVLDSLSQEFSGSSIYEFPYEHTFYTSSSMSDIYINIKGKYFENNLMNRYTVHISRYALKMNADFSSDKTSGSSPLTVNFSDQSTAKYTTISSWHWDFGDGTTSNEQHPQHTYSKKGVYKVTLTVRDDHEMQDTEEKFNYIAVSSNFDDLLGINIVAMEYYFDKDPGVGNGQSIPISSSNTVEVKTNLDVSHLNSGLHHLYIRAKDEKDHWGLVQSRPVLVTNHSERDDHLKTYQSKISDIEYFFDKCPGIGNGDKLSFSPSTELTLNDTIDVTNVTPGLHRVYFRAKDEAGQWGIIQSRPLLVTSHNHLGNTEQGYVAKITSLEYFFDTAPEPGKGYPISVTSDSEVSITTTFDTSNLDPGMHRVYIRAKDETDTWGIVQSRPVLIESFDESLPDIVKIEYFFNTDPGQGSGSSILFEPAPYVHIETNVQVNHLQKGAHRIYVRAQDDNDAWSQSQYANFSIIDSPTPEITSFKVSDHSSTPVITFEILDNFSGIDVSSITFSLDQTEYIHGQNYTDYFNASTGLLTYPVQNELANGVHMVTITTGDTAGNVQVKAYTFTVNDHPPSIEHQALTQAVSGKPLNITATVLDNDPIAGVFLYYRPKMNEQEYLVQEMSMDDSGIWSAKISEIYCTSSGIRYFIKAIDDLGNETITHHMDVSINDQTFDFHLNQGWNLISLPVTPSNTALSHLFPDYEAAYEYKNGAYLSVNNIVPGKGYWLKVPSEKGYSISGQPFSSWTIDSVNGWHLVGSPHNGVSPDDMSVRVIFRYLNGAYEQVFTLLPGFGYWVKISE